MVRQFATRGLSQNGGNVQLPEPDAAGYVGVRRLGEHKSFVGDRDELPGVWHGGPINPKAANVSCQQVVERFVSRFEKFVPSVFNGIVNELPAVIPSNGSIPWDDDLVIKYRSRYKKEILDAIPALFVPVDDVYARNRAHVYNFIIQSMQERFPAVIETALAKLRMTQWVLLPEYDIAGGSEQLSELPALPQGQIAVAGAQCLDGTEAGFHLFKAVADSNALEYRRETVAVLGRSSNGQSASIQSLKNEIDTCVSLGVNHLLLDGCYANPDRRSHFKTPFNHSWYQPEWPWIGELCDYAENMMPFASGLRTRHVAVVMPYASAMAIFKT